MYKTMRYCNGRAVGGGLGTVAESGGRGPPFSSSLFYKHWLKIKGGLLRFSILVNCLKTNFDVKNLKILYYIFSGLKFHSILVYPSTKFHSVSVSRTIHMPLARLGYA